MEYIYTHHSVTTLCIMIPERGVRYALVEPERKRSKECEWGWTSKRANVSPSSLLQLQQRHIVIQKQTWCSSKAADKSSVSFPRSQADIPTCETAVLRETYTDCTARRFVQQGSCSFNEYILPLITVLSTTYVWFNMMRSCSDRLTSHSVFNLHDSHCAFPWAVSAAEMESF